MEECVPTQNTGLRGVKVATTKISAVDGKAGRLIYRGYLTGDLAEKVSYEEAGYLLLYEKLPDVAELSGFKDRLSANRQLPGELITAFQNMPSKALPMDILQASVAMLANYDPSIRTPSQKSAMESAISLIAKFPTVVATWDRIRNGLEPVDPNPDLGAGANFLYMLSGKMPDDELAGFFDTCLVLHAEHAFNASTFAVREVASTMAHIYAAVAAGVGSLSGGLHGGANTRVMQMLLKIGAIENVESYVKKVIETGEKIMGLGHAVYKTDDPRAHILAPMSRAMGRRRGDTRWYEMSRLLEKTGKAAFKEKKGREIYVNVDFYSASLYYYMGIPVDMFTPVFAISRIAGWTAHFIEEQFGGAAPKTALYRPDSDYVGEYCGPEECTWVPLDER